MKLDFLRVFEDVKENDIMYGGTKNLSLQNEIDKCIDHENENDVNSCKYLLVQFEFYIFHLCSCYRQLVDGKDKEELLNEGYTTYEIMSAEEAVRKYGDKFDTKSYLYVSNSKIGLIATTIENILEGKGVGNISKEVEESAIRRIAYANKFTQTKGHSIYEKEKASV